MSLRKVTNWHIEQRGVFFRKWLFFVTKTKYFVLSNRKYFQAKSLVKESSVSLIGRDCDRLLWWAEDGLYWTDIGLSSEDVELLIWDRRRRQDTKLERLRKMRNREEESTRAHRSRIPDEIRVFVWERDRGQCVQCGTDKNLQFDHIIPVSKGGGNEINNVQILCGDCNRRKGDSII